MRTEISHGPGIACVRTTNGPIRGYIDHSIYHFKGVPYAKAVRFHAPELPDPWEEELECTSYGYVCPLMKIDKPNGEVATPHRFWPMDEDCLNLNVWTPGLDNSRRPVLVWFHGGGFEAGSAIEQLCYEGGNMAQLGDVVVVSVNHRLNILGFMDLSDFGEEYANSGNAGMDDIIASLKWVRDNIASFGGDPDNVTVFGQSGGGAKVTTLLQMPAADGLFHRGVNMSGVVGMLPDAVGSGREVVEAMMKELRLDNVKQLETVPYAHLARAYRKVSPALAAEGKYVGDRPQPNAFYLGDPVVNGFRKESAHIPMLIGTVFAEFSGLFPDTFDKHAISEQEGTAIIRETLGQETDRLIPMFRKAYPDRAITDLLRLDILFRWPAMPYIHKRAALNSCTWTYLFNQDLPYNGGTCPGHCNDIAYWFHNTELVPSSYVEGVTEKLEEQMFASLMAFARTGDPNNDAVPSWPCCTADTDNTMFFDSNTGLRPNHDAELLPAFAPVMGPITAARMSEFMAKAQH